VFPETPEPLNVPPGLPVTKADKSIGSAPEQILAGADQLAERGLLKKLQPTELYDTTPFSVKKAAAPSWAGAWLGM
jgi:hypothetical protein